MRLAVALLIAAFTTTLACSVGPNGPDGEPGEEGVDGPVGPKGIGLGPLGVPGVISFPGYEGLDRVMKQVTRKLIDASPRRSWGFYGCPRGPPGMPGMMGPLGEADLPENISVWNIEDLINRRQLPVPPHACDESAAVEEVYRRVLEEIPPGPVVESWPMGPPGPMGNRGDSLSQGIRAGLHPLCFNSTVERNTLGGISALYNPRCPFIEELVTLITEFTRRQIEGQHCPAHMEGVMGRPGPKGMNFLDQYQPLPFEEIADTVCPRMLDGPDRREL
jgi:hypothetical protein